MRKLIEKDLLALLGCDFVAAILLVEHFCGLKLALECLIVWQMLNLILHICVLKNYTKITITTEEVENG